jgi:hypothetical protein
MAVNNLNTPGVGIQPSIVDAKGDLIAGTAADAVSRLAAGTNGHVLVADSGETTGLKWNNPGTVGGLVHINTTAIGTTVAGVSIDDVFSATYDNYFIQINNDTSTNSNSLIARLRVSGSDNNSNNYYSSIAFVNFSGAAVVSGANNAGLNSFFTIGYSTSGTSGVGSFYLYDPFLTKKTRYAGFGGGLDATDSTIGRGGHMSVTTSYTGISLYIASGTMSGGSISIYGLRK